MIDVLLATYRPDAAMLREQVDSIRAQRGVEVNLICREDAAGEGACANFSALLALSRADYVAFADQDDVWLPDKLAKSLAKLRGLESAYGRDAPLCVFTDATVVDRSLNVLDTSLFHRTKVDPMRLLPRQLVFQNVPYGNTMLFNAALRDLACPVPSVAFMHDHWLALVAASFGHLAHLDEPTLLYRQHGHNVIGGEKIGWLHYSGMLRRGLAVPRARLYANVRQTEAFADRFGDRAPACFRALVGLDRKPWPLRVATPVRHRIFKCGLVRNVGTWAIV